MTLKSRPDDLPDFRAPPLNEVVLGVQFSPPQAYQQIHAGEVWSLFKSEFSKVEEHPPLPPEFETFGLPTRKGQISLIAAPTHSRFWFLRQDGDELIQFQRDRLLHNWRKVGDESNEYPRFEGMISRFQRELEAFESFVDGLADQSLSISQCEITYVNHIATSALDEPSRVTEWLRFPNFPGRDPEDFMATFREVILDGEDKPVGRLICEVATGLKSNHQRTIILNLTVRGAPIEPSVGGAIAFLKMGRERIVRKFAEITTQSAHEHWGRTA